jgi:hypothetical protein
LSDQDMRASAPKTKHGAVSADQFLRRIATNRLAVARICK